MCRLANVREEKVNIEIADGKTLTSQGKGTVDVIVMLGNGAKFEVRLDDVFYVPNLTGCLLSVKKLTEKGFSVIFEKTRCSLKKDNE